MKKGHISKRVKSGILSIILAGTMSSPAFATATAIHNNNEENSDLAAIQAIAQDLCPEYADQIDYTTLGHFDQPDEASATIRVSAERMGTSAQPNQLRDWQSTATVYNETQFCDALEDSTISTILLGANITLTAYIDIDHPVTFGSLNGQDCTITAPANTRHFQITDQGSYTAPLTITFFNVILAGNHLGGGIDITDSYVVINNANFTECKNGYGAALFASSVRYNEVSHHREQSGSIVINGGTITGCDSATSAIYSHGPAEVNGVTIQGNNCTGVLGLNLGSSVAVINIRNSTIRNNHTDSDGGGVRMLFTRCYISDSTTIENNYADGIRGGGVFAQYSELFVNDSLIKNNGLDGEDNTEVYGAGIYVLGPLQMNNTIVRDNYVGGLFGGGAGIFVRSMSNNGISYVGDDETVEIEDSLITYNTCNCFETFWENINEWDDEEYGSVDFNLIRCFTGGGICIENMDATIKNTEISYNHAMRGGGIYQDFDIEMSGGVITSPQYMLTLTGCMVENNTATLEGGNIWARRITITGDDLSTDVSYIRYGKAGRADNGWSVEEQTGLGGGIFIGKSGYLYIKVNYVIISYNLAGRWGAGIYLDEDAMINVGVNASINLGLIFNNYLCFEGGIVNNIGTYYDCPPIQL